MTKQEVRKIFEEAEAILTDGHYVYTNPKPNGDHGSVYVNKDAIYAHVKKLDALCRALAEPFCILERRVDTVIGAALGGIPLSQRVASHLCELQGNDVMSVFAEKVDGKLAVTRDQMKHITNKYVLVVEDILNSGGSARSLGALVRAFDGKVVGVSALCNRGGVTREQLDAQRLHFLLSVTLEKYPESECPLCRDGVPVNTNLGKGREFLARLAAAR